MCKNYLRGKTYFFQYTDCITESFSIPPPTAILDLKAKACSLDSTAKMCLREMNS